MQLFNIICVLPVVPLLFGCWQSDSSEIIAPENADFSGRYRLTFGPDPESTAGCWLLVVHHLTDEPFDRLQFELACFRDLPSHNSGYVLDDMLVENHVSNTAVYSSDYGECHLVFEFRVDIVEVIQIGHYADCGFGGAVAASGSYEKVNSELPRLGCMRMDDPCGLTE